MTFWMLRSGKISRRQHRNASYSWEKVVRYRKVKTKKKDTTDFGYFSTLTCLDNIVAGYSTE